MNSGSRINITRKVLKVNDSYLKTQVQDFWVFHVNGNNAINPVLTVPPLGFPIMHIHTGTKTGFYPLATIEIDSLVIGQLKIHADLYPRSGLELFVINFKPYGFYNLFGELPPSGNQNSKQGFEYFGNEKIQKIIQDLKNCKSGACRNLILEDFLLNNQRNNIKRFDFLDGIVDEILNSNGLISINDLIKNKCSLRTVQRYFSDVIGVSPKTFTRILRHKYIIQQMYENPETKWNDLVFKGYYFDHSHFIKDFTAFSKTIPSLYNNLKTSIVAEYIVKQWFFHILSKQKTVLSHFYKRNLK